MMGGMAGMMAGIGPILFLLLTIIGVLVFAVAFKVI